MTKAKNEKQREYDKRTGYAAQKKYLKKSTKQYLLRFSMSTDADLIEHLDNQDNKTGYIRDLIRADMARNGK